MKILYIIHEFYPECHGGTEKFIYNIAKFMMQFGHEVKVITYSSYNNSDYDKVKNDVLIKEFKYNDISVMALKLDKSYELTDYILENDSLEEISEKIIETEKPDLIHFGHIMRMGEFVKAAIKLRVHYIVTLTDFFTICPKYFLITDKFNLCEGPMQGTLCNQKCYISKFSTIDRFEVAKRYLFKAQSVIAPSNFLAEIFRDELKKLKIKVIGHGIDKNKLKENLRTYGKNDKIIFGFLGGSAFIKGGHIIIEAINSISNFGNSNLKIYGFENDEIYNIMLSMRKIKNIEICGVFSDESIGDIFKEIDIIIIPSICYESYSLILHEALASKVPVIVSNQGALNEKIVHGVNGFKFERGNYTELGKIMSYIIDNTDILNKLKNNIESNYISSIENEAKQYEMEYLRCREDNETYNLLNINQNWAELYYRNMTDKSIFYIDNNSWNSYISIIASKFNNIEKDLLYNMRLKLDYLYSKFGDRDINYIIWGASNSGKVTEELIKLCLPNFKLVGFIDKFKTGVMDNIEIFNPSQMNKLRFEYMFIATSPGKNEAVKAALDINLSMINDFMFGYGVM